MALESISVTAGAYTKSIGVDTISGVEVPLTKILDGTPDSEEHIVGTTARGLHVEPHLLQAWIPITSGGLTTSTTAYTAGDQVGTQFTFTSCARASGGTGTIVGASLLDKADIIGAYNLWVYTSSVTPASDNAVFSVSDSDQANLLWVIPLSAPLDGGANRFAQTIGISLPYVCTGGTSLFGLLQCAVGHTFFGATTDLIATLWVVKD